MWRGGVSRCPPIPIDRDCNPAILGHHSRRPTVTVRFSPPTLRGNAPPVTLPKRIRLRDEEHCKFVANQPCVVCGRVPSDPHHSRLPNPARSAARSATSSRSRSAACTTASSTKGATSRPGGKRSRSTHADRPKALATDATRSDQTFRERPIPDGSGKRACGVPTFIAACNSD